LTSKATTGKVVGGDVDREVDPLLPSVDEELAPEPKTIGIATSPSVGDLSEQLERLDLRSPSTGADHEGEDGGLGAQVGVILVRIEF
jgi:hypothetical protein